MVFTTVLYIFFTLMMHDTQKQKRVMKEIETQNANLSYSQRPLFN
ncbi:Uncharacterised protein [uncultured archaeon]|nr:Uncharacterised protein [uncultured archaeon]